MIGPVMYTFRFLKNWLTMQIASKIAVTVICLVFNFINLPPKIRIIVMILLKAPKCNDTGILSCVTIKNEVE